MSDYCESCGARILFAKQVNGKTIPLNKTRARVYHYDERKRTATPHSQPNGEIFLAHISHFLTCPHASAHSKGKAQRS